jgi:hypothetical protein
MQANRSAPLDGFEGVRNAVENGQLERLRVLVSQEKNNVNDSNLLGFTALHFAAQNAYRGAACVQYLAELGANLNAQDHGGWTALHYASIDGLVEVLHALIWAGALIDVKDNEGRTPLRLALYGNRFRIAIPLLDHGANIANVRLDCDLTELPNWIRALASQSLCRTVAVIVIGIHKFHRTVITASNDVHVMRMIAKHIWSLRVDAAWIVPIVNEE